MSTAPAAKSGKAVCIWLHGLGDSGAGWSFFKAMYAKSFPQLKWVFPNSPNSPVTLAGGEKMPSWMDLNSLPVTKHTPEDAAGYASSSKLIHAMIDKEIAEGGYAPSQVYLGGFSQGGSMSLYAGLSYKAPLGGVISFSGWLPHKLWESTVSKSPTLAASRVLLVHGDHDSKVLFDRSQAARDTLTGVVSKVEFFEFDGDHTFAEESKAWLEAFFKAGGVQ
jgi:predicted esterase